MATSSVNTKMRVYHRYLGFFLAGIMAVYALSGITMIFRNTDFLKKKKVMHETLAANLPIEEVGKELRFKDLKAKRESGDTIFFSQGFYIRSTGAAEYTVTKLPYVMDKMTKLHKANTNSPLYYLNIFFGLSLLFFVVSSFWMFMPKTTIFKKGLIFTLVGVVLTLVLLFV